MLRLAGTPGDPPLSGWAITQTNYRGNPRYFAVRVGAIFKKVREENGRPVLTEISNELICNELGNRLGMPFVPTLFGVLPGQGLGLYSFLLGEREFNPQDVELRGKIKNLQKLKDLFVFDQWVINDDRAPRHIVVGEEPTIPGVLYLYAYDNGHTLNGYNGQKWTSEAFSEPSARLIGQTLFDSGITAYQELQGAVSKIKSIPDREIQRAIDTSISQIMSNGPEAQDVERAISNGEVVRKILTMRRDCLEEILKSWCAANGKSLA